MCVCALGVICSHCSVCSSRRTARPVSELVRGHFTTVWHGTHFFLRPVNKLCGKQQNERWDTGEGSQREWGREEETGSETSAVCRDGDECLIIENLRPCWANMGTRRSRQRCQRWTSGGGCGHRIIVDGWWNRAISWRSAGFGMSLSAFLNSLQSDGHFEVSQSCLNPAWKDAENREAQRRDRNIQRGREWRGRTKGRIDDGWNTEGGSESNQE